MGSRSDTRAAPVAAALPANRITAASGAALLAILTLAALLRGYALASQGYMYWDEGHYSLEGQFLADTWQRLLGTHPDPASPPWGRPPVLVKPTHAFLLSLGMLVAGPTPLAALAISAGSGVLTVLVVFLLGRALYSTGTGLLAAAFLAVLPLHVAYSRQALSEANTALFFSAAMLAYWVGRGQGWRPGWGVAAAGVLLGVTVTTNYRLYIMLLVLFTCELSLWFLEQRQSRRAFLRRAILLTYASALPVAAWIAFFHWLQGYYETSGLRIWEPVIPYESQLKGFVLMMRALPRPVVGNLDPLYYPFVLWTLAGPALVVAAMVGIAHLTRERKGFSQNLLVAAWLLVPLVFYALLTDKAPRCLAVALPALALLAARGVLTTRRMLHHLPLGPALGGAAALVLAGVVMLQGAVDSWDMAGRQGGYVAATAYLRESGISRAIAGQAPSVHYYTAGSLALASLPKGVGELRALYQRGFRHILIDDQPYLDAGIRPLASDLEQRLRPLAVFPDGLKQGPLFFLEHSEWMGVDLSTTLALHQEVRRARGPAAVKLYDLDGYFGSR